MPVNTFRAWFIGLIWSIILPGMNQFFFFRYPSVTVSAVSGFLFLLRSVGKANDMPDPALPARARF